MVVDSYKFLNPATRVVVKAWIARAPRTEIPWTPLSKPLSECTVALVTSAGIVRSDDCPFDQEGERRNPWWGDPTFREIPLETTERDIQCHHLHIDPSHALRDLDVVLPMRRLQELATAGVVGSAASVHYSFMGYILDPRVLVAHTAEALASRMRARAIDAVLLVPA